MVISLVCNVTISGYRMYVHRRKKYHGSAQCCLQIQYLMGTNPEKVAGVFSLCRSATGWYLFLLQPVHNHSMGSVLLYEQGATLTRPTMANIQIN